MKVTAAIALGLFHLGVLIGLAQLWFRPWTPETFLKILITDGALLAIALIWYFMTKERRDYEKTRDGQRLG
ncbi:MAG TPA: hypothetical protein VGL41_14870 [Roseiarcus sp.]|jgi:hypothetical protein